jgi:hypothetical protein
MKNINQRVLFFTYFLFFCLAHFKIKSQNLTHDWSMQNAQTNRLKAEYYWGFRKNYDSASYYYKKFISDTNYTYPKDILAYANCSLKLKNMKDFEYFLNSAVISGADLELINNWNDNLNETEKLILRNYLDSNFISLATQFINRIDSNIVRKIDEMLLLDQYVRNLEANTEFSRVVRYNMMRVVDSMNYDQLSTLLDTCFIGFKKFGPYSEYLIPLLMHTTDSDELKWSHIFRLLKTEVRKGNISPMNVAMIADRHYSNVEKPSYYYGVLHHNNLPLFDCKRVDEFRREIGLPTLREEYEFYKLKIPTCYESKE